MTRITEGHLVRHYQGIKGGRDAALLDIAQDYALHLLHTTGLFDHGLIFKGGTALRKFRAGNAGSLLDRPRRRRARREAGALCFGRLSMESRSTASPSRSKISATTAGEAT